MPWLAPRLELEVPGPGWSRWRENVGLGWNAGLYFGYPHLFSSTMVWLMTWLCVKYLNNTWMGCHEIWSRRSRCPENESSWAGEGSHLLDSLTLPAFSSQCQRCRKVWLQFLSFCFRGKNTLSSLYCFKPIIIVLGEAKPMWWRCPCPTAGLCPQSTSGESD